ncbi:unnamed protein product [Thlaspi arvense]|uniref:Pectate lyase n=1 Tax=Thlaspi arvense TaxID=13288 RepID=A0AAU9S2D9_THLAR|nr:unnamed protein product [Thlaspi arvense]
MSSSSQKLTSACFVLLLIFIIALTATNLGNNGISRSRKLKTEDSQSFNSSTMAIRNEGAELNEHAVADPDLIAREVSVLVQIDPGRATVDRFQKRHALVFVCRREQVMLLGHSDSHTQDKLMQVTIAYNHFGEGLIQRMPRCRHGYFHVVNNDYTHWEMYAIGGSANPTILSQGNRYAAPKNLSAKEVTKRVKTETSEWKKWNWRSEGDMLVNGAFFIPSGEGASASYSRASSLAAKPASMVDSITSTSGALGCREGKPCY